MAAIEKVCEFSHEYPGGEMWNYKRNHIQIMPKYRKEFRGHKAVLHVFENGLHEVWKFGSSCDAQLHCINPNPTDENWDNHEYFRSVERMPWGKREAFGVFFNNIGEYKRELKKRKQRLLTEYAYVLEVPTLPGEVNGLYVNFSFDLKSVKRRLARMIGKKNLKVVKHTGTMYEFLETKRS